MMDSVPRLDQIGRSPETVAVGNLSLKSFFDAIEYYVHVMSQHIIFIFNISRHSNNVQGFNWYGARVSSVIISNASGPGTELDSLFCGCDDMCSCSALFAQSTDETLVGTTSHNF